MVNWNSYISNGLSTAVNLAMGNTAGAISSGIGATMGLFDFGSSNSAKAAQKQYENNLKLQQQAQQWNEYMYKNRYTFQVQDLKNAGINPLFGMGQAPSITSGTNSVGIADAVGEQNNKFQQMMTLLDFRQNLSAKRAQTKLLENQANTEAINTNLKSLEVIQQQINNLKGQKDLKYYDKEKLTNLRNLESQTYKNLKEAQNTMADTKLINTTVRGTAREVKLQEEWDKKHRILKNLANTARRFGWGGSLGISLPLKK